MPGCWKIGKLLIQNGFGALRVANALNATNPPSHDMLPCILSNPFKLIKTPGQPKTTTKQNKTSVSSSQLRCCQSKSAHEALISMETMSWKKTTFNS